MVRSLTWSICVCQLRFSATRSMSDQSRPPSPACAASHSHASDDSIPKPLVGNFPVATHGHKTSIYRYRLSQVSRLFLSNRRSSNSFCTASSSQLISKQCNTTQTGPDEASYLYGPLFPAYLKTKQTAHQI